MMAAVFVVLKYGPGRVYVRWAYSNDVMACGWWLGHGTVGYGSKGQVSLDISEDMGSGTIY